MREFEILKKMFPKINSICFKTRKNNLFLEIGIDASTLKEVTTISKEINKIIDQNEWFDKKEYFLDIFSNKSKLNI